MKTHGPLLLLGYAVRAEIANKLIEDAYVYHKKERIDWNKFYAYRSKIWIGYGLYLKSMAITGKIKNHLYGSHLILTWDLLCWPLF